MAEKEYIEREAAIKIASGYCHPSNVANELAKLPAADVVERASGLIGAIPAADVRPVVLCKDCKCYRQSSFVDKHMECARSGLSVHSVDFCSLGEKREETVVHCNNEENAKIIATILNMDADGHYLSYSSIFGEEEEPAPPKE